MSHPDSPSNHISSTPAHFAPQKSCVHGFLPMPWNKNLVPKHSSSWILRVFVLSHPGLTIKSHMYSMDTVCTTKITDAWLHGQIMDKNIVLKHRSSVPQYLRHFASNAEANHISMAKACTIKITDPQHHSNNMTKKIPQLGCSWILSTFTMGHPKLTIKPHFMSVNRDCSTKITDT